VVSEFSTPEAAVKLLDETVRHFGPVTALVNASGEASFVTGQTLAVNGGAYIG